MNGPSDIERGHTFVGFNYVLKCVNMYFEFEKKETKKRTNTPSSSNPKHINLIPPYTPQPQFDLSSSYISIL